MWFAMLIVVSLSGEANTYQIDGPMTLDDCVNAIGDNMAMYCEMRPLDD